MPKLSRHQDKTDLPPTNKIVPYNFFQKIREKKAGMMNGAIYKLEESSSKLLKQYNLDSKSEFLIKYSLTNNQILCAYVSSFVLREIIGSAAVELFIISKKTQYYLGSKMIPNFKSFFSYLNLQIESDPNLQQIKQNCFTKGQSKTFLSIMDFKSCYKELLPYADLFTSDTKVKINYASIFVAQKDYHNENFGIVEGNNGEKKFILQDLDFTFTGYHREIFPIESYYFGGLDNAINLLTSFTNFNINSLEKIKPELETVKKGAFEEFKMLLHKSQVDFTQRLSSCLLLNDLLNNEFDEKKYLQFLNSVNKFTDFTDRYNNNYILRMLIKHQEVGEIAQLISRAEDLISSLLSMYLQGEAPDLLRSLMPFLSPDLKKKIKIELKKKISKGEECLDDCSFIFTLQNDADSTDTLLILGSDNINYHGKELDQ